MNEKRRCDGCGKEYWPMQAWQHAKCAADGKGKRITIGSGGCDGAVQRAGLGKEVVKDDRSAAVGVDRKVERKQRWDRKSYNAYQREYMKKRRAK